MNKQIDNKKKSTFKDFFKKEFFLALRFGLVGCIATLIHMLVVWILIEGSLLPVLIANLLAFMAAFGFSFFGNYYWTFSKPGQRRRVMGRFFLISAFAFSANTLLLASLLTADWLSPMTSTLSAAALIPVVTFLASRLWGFRLEENCRCVN